MALSLFSKIINFKHWNIFIHILRYRNFLRFPYVKIDFWTEIWDKKNKKIWKNTWIRKWVIIQDWELEIWYNTNIWPYTCIFPWLKTKIGNNVLVGPHVWIYWWNHNYKDKYNMILDQWDSSKWITIEDDVWIWANAVILDWVIVKKWSIIWAWAIITKDTQEYSISVGNPWKILWYRL